MIEGGHTIITMSLQTWDHGTCRVGKVDIHYLRSGGDKPPLVMLHGLTGSGACMLPMGRILAKRFDVILPDARGHGASSGPSEGYRYNDLAADIMGLIDALGLSSPVLAGHSMGGMTAAVAACDLGKAVKALVLVDPTFISLAWQHDIYESHVSADHEAALRLTRDELIAQACLRHPDRPGELIDHQVDAKRRTSLHAFDILTPPNPDWRHLVRDIDVPMLLLIGDRGVVSWETADELASLNPLLRSVLIADAGHGMPFDKPVEAADVVLASVPV